MPSNKHSPWSRLVAITGPLFHSEVRWRAAGALAVITALLLVLNALNVANSYVGRNFMTAISERNRDQYLKFAVFYMVVFGASTLAAVTSQFVQDRLALLWREWLSAHLIDRYLSGRALQVVRANKEIDNPDQRIAEDVRTFTSTLLGFGIMILNAVMTTVAFAGVLWSITPLLLTVAVGYAVVGSLLTVLVGHRLVSLNNLQLRKEADLRYSLIHSREHLGAVTAEDHALEERRIHRRLIRVVQNSRAIIGVSRNVGFFTSGYNYLVQLIPILVVAPRYFRGQIAFGVVTQSAMAFAQLLGAFSLIVVQFGSITTFTAVIWRIGTLCEQLDGWDATPGLAGAPPRVPVTHSPA